MRTIAIALTTALLALAACGDDQPAGPDAGTCRANRDCPSDLCVVDRDAGVGECAPAADARP